MLFYGTGKYIPDDCKVYNLNSMKEGFPRFKFLVPPNQLGKFLDRDFDIAYFNYIFQNDNVFYEFFSIIYELYINNDVYILVDSSMDWAENIGESLLKVIQQRYGYNGYLCDSEEDDLWINNSYESPHFDPTFGIYNLDIDKERYTLMVETNRLMSGGALYYVD